MLPARAISWLGVFEDVERGFGQLPVPTTNAVTAAAPSAADTFRFFAEMRRRTNTPATNRAKLKA
jgi:hypothetical protein